MTPDDHLEAAERLLDRNQETTDPIEKISNSMQALAHVFTGYMRDDFEEDPDPGDKEPEPFRGLRTIHSVLDEIQGLPQSHLRGGTA